MRRSAAAALLLAAACSDWRDKVDPARAREEPVQEATGGEPIEWEAKGYRVKLTPRAAYRITGYAVETSRELLDAWDFVAPLDVALVWGPVARPEVLKQLRFHLSRRYVSYRYDAPIPGAPQDVLASHIANHHLIPAGELVGKALARIRTGDLVTLAGRLVDVEIRDGSGIVAAAMRTSLRRDDTGSGACENLYVEIADVERP